MEHPNLIPFLLLLLILHLSTGAGPSPTAAAGGHWQLLQQNIDISATHMQLLSNDRVVIFDGSDFGSSNLTFPAGNCRRRRRNKVNCTAHSAVYDIPTNTFRPLMIDTTDDGVWCSSAAVTSDGRRFVRHVQIGFKNEMVEDFGWDFLDEDLRSGPLALYQKERAENTLQQ